MPFNLNRFVDKITGVQTDTRERLRLGMRFFQIEKIRRADVNLINMLKTSPDEGTPSFVIENLI